MLFLCLRLTLKKKRKLEDMVQKLVSYCSTKYFGERSIRQHIIDTLTERRRSRKDLITPSNSSNITISINIRITINISICINSSINIIININITINISNFISITSTVASPSASTSVLNINLRFINEEC
eukprot:Em0243g2a